MSVSDYVLARCFLFSLPLSTYQMIFSGSRMSVLGAVSALSAIFTFARGDIGDFCRALGVFMILLVQRTSFQRFLVSFVSQVQSAYAGVVAAARNR
jgi:hypothetical protein